MPESSQPDLRSITSTLESAAFNFGFRFIPDAGVRAQYMLKASQMSAELAEQVRTGRLLASEAAKLAADLRNSLMNSLRGMTSEFSQAYASSLKAAGKTLPELEATYAQRLFGKGFQALSTVQKNSVWSEIVLAAGRPQAKVNQIARSMGLAGRGFIGLTMTISTYNILTATDKLSAVGHESAVLGGGMLGSVAGGAAAGLMCGPAAPVCTAIGVFVGGTAFALGAQYTFDSFWR